MPPTKQELKVVIDGTKCRGHGLCVLAAPTLFDVVGLGMAKHLPCDLNDKKVRLQVEKAIRYCVEDAISLQVVKEARS